MAVQEIQHKLISQGFIHGLINWEVTTVAARDLLVVTEADKGKLCKVGSGAASTYFILAQLNPVVWLEFITTTPEAFDGTLYGIGGFIPVIDQATVDDPGTPSGRYYIKVSNLPSGGIGYVDHWSLEDPDVSMQVYHVVNTIDVYKRFHDGVSWSSWGLASGTGTDGLSLIIESRITASLTLAETDAGKYLRVSDATGCVVNVPLNDTVNIPVGALIHFRQSGAGQLTFTPEGGVTITTSETLLTRKQNSTVSLLKIATDIWDLTGDLELAE